MPHGNVGSNGLGGRKAEGGFPDEEVVAPLVTGLDVLGVAGVPVVVLGRADALCVVVNVGADVGVTEGAALGLSAETFSPARLRNR